MRRPAAAVAALLVALALAAAACSPAASSGPPSPAGFPSPAGSPSPVAGDGSASPVPTATPWPGDIADAVIALGTLDSQIAAFGQDMDAAVTAQDLTAMAAAAEGLVNLLDGYASPVTTVSGFVATKGLGEAYAKAFVEMRAGAAAISEGVRTGSAATIETGIADLSSGITTYGLARKALGPLLEQAISQKKMYVK